MGTLPPSLQQRSLLPYPYWLGMEGPVQRVLERDTVTVGRVILTLEYRTSGRHVNGHRHRHPPRREIVSDLIGKKALIDAETEAGVTASGALSRRYTC